MTRLLQWPYTPYKLLASPGGGVLMTRLLQRLFEVVGFLLITASSWIVNGVDRAQQ